MPSFSTARLMTWKYTLILRTFSVSRIQREVIQQKGHVGSNQKSARTWAGAVWALPSLAVDIVEVTNLLCMHARTAVEISVA